MWIVANAALLVISTVACLILQDSGSGLAAPQTLIGEWRGQSICQVRQSPCRDEESVYRIKALEKKPGWFSLEGGRIANGRIVNMGARPIAASTQNSSCSNAASRQESFE